MRVDSDWVRRFQRRSPQVEDPVRGRDFSADRAAQSSRRANPVAAVK